MPGIAMCGESVGLVGMGIFMPLCVVSCGVACAVKGVPIEIERASAKPQPLAIKRDDKNIFHPK
jgi:hypothetical protein